MKETRHLWVGGLPSHLNEERIAEYFERYGRIDRVKLLEKDCDELHCAVVAFVDIRSAQKAHSTSNILGENHLKTSYSEAAVMTSSRSSSKQRSSSRRDPPTHFKNECSPLNTFEGLTENNSKKYSQNRCKSDKSDRSLNLSKPNHKLHRERKAHHQNEMNNKLILKSNQKKKIKSNININLNVNKFSINSKRTTKPAINRLSDKYPPSSSKSNLKRKSMSVKREQVESDDSDRSATSITSESSSSSSSKSSSATSSQSSSSASSSASCEVNESKKKMNTIRVSKLPSRSTLSTVSLQDLLYDEFKKFGKIKGVEVVNATSSDARYAEVHFFWPLESKKVYDHQLTKALHNSKFEVCNSKSNISEFSYDKYTVVSGVVSEKHPQASRTLHLGSIEKNISYNNLQSMFGRLGEVLSIEIRKQSNGFNSASIQFIDIATVVRIINKMQDREKYNKNNFKLGFAKTPITSCLWIDKQGYKENSLMSYLERFGKVELVLNNRNNGQSAVIFQRWEQAQDLFQEVRKRKNINRLKVDYGGFEFLRAFNMALKKSAQPAANIDSIRHLIHYPSSTMTSPSLTSPRSSSSFNPYPRDSYYDDNSTDYYHHSSSSWKPGASGGWEQEPRRSRLFPRSITPPRGKCDEDLEPRSHFYDAPHHHHHRNETRYAAGSDYYEELRASNSSSSSSAVNRDVTDLDYRPTSGGLPQLSEFHPRRHHHHHRTSSYISDHHKSRRIASDASLQPHHYQRSRRSRTPSPNSRPLHRVSDVTDFRTRSPARVSRKSRPTDYSPRREVTSPRNPVKSKVVTSSTSGDVTAEIYYHTGGSATPTRDENSDVIIGEMMIKQPEAKQQNPVKMKLNKRNKLKGHLGPGQGLTGTQQGLSGSEKKPQKKVRAHSGGEVPEKLASPSSGRKRKLAESVDGEKKKMKSASSDAGDDVISCHGNMEQASASVDDKLVTNCNQIAMDIDVTEHANTPRDVISHENSLAVDNHVIRNDDVIGEIAQRSMDGKSPNVTDQAVTCEVSMTTGQKLVAKQSIKGVVEQEDIYTVVDEYKDDSWDTNMGKDGISSSQTPSTSLPSTPLPPTPAPQTPITPAPQTPITPAPLPPAHEVPIISAPQTPITPAPQPTVETIKSDPDLYLSPFLYPKPDYHQSDDVISSNEKASSVEAVNKSSMKEEVKKVFKTPKEDETVKLVYDEISKMAKNKATPPLPVAVDSPFTPKSTPSKHSLSSVNETPSPSAPRSAHNRHKPEHHDIKRTLQQQRVSRDRMTSSSSKHHKMMSSDNHHQKHHHKKQDHRKRHHNHYHHHNDTNYHHHRIENQSLHYDVIPKVITLTTGCNTSKNKSMSQQELEKVRMELLKIKQQPSYSHIDSSDDDVIYTAPPLSPILKSPNYGRDLLKTADGERHVRVTKSKSDSGFDLKMRLKSIGKVKKRTKICEEISENIESCKNHQTLQFQIGDNDLLKSNIFEQDLERLLHGKFAYSKIEFLPDQSPLFSILYQQLVAKPAPVEPSATSIQPSATIISDQQTKNVQPLSNSVPACAERECVVNAGTDDAILRPINPINTCNLIQLTSKDRLVSENEESRSFDDVTHQEESNETKPEVIRDFDEEESKHSDDDVIKQPLDGREVMMLGDDEVDDSNILMENDLMLEETVVEVEEDFMQITSKMKEDPDQIKSLPDPQLIPDPQRLEDLCKEESLCPLESSKERDEVKGKAEMKKDRKMKKMREVSDVIIASDEQLSDEEKQKYSAKKKHHREMKIASKKNRTEEGSQKKRHHLDLQRRSSSDPKLKSQFHSLLLSLSSDNDDDVTMTSSSKLKMRQSRVKRLKFGSGDNRKRKRIPDNLKSDSSGSDVKTKLDDVIDPMRKPRRSKEKVVAPPGDEKKKSGKMRAKRRTNEHQLTDCSDNDVITAQLTNSPLRSKPTTELDACDVTGSHKRPKPLKSRLVSKSNKQAMKIAAKKAAKSKLHLKTSVTSSPHVTNRKSEVAEMTSATSKLMTSRLLDSPKSPMVESKETVKRNFHPLMKSATLTSSSASSSDDETSGKLHLSRTLTEEEQKKLLGFKRMTSLSSKDHKRVIEKKQSHDDVINAQDRDSREDERRTHLSSREPSSGIKDRRLSWMRDKLMTSERPRVKKQLPVVEKARTSSTSSVKEKLKKDWLASSVPSVSCRFDKASSASMRVPRPAVKERHRVVATEARHNLQHFRKSLDSRFRESFPKRFEHTKSANWNRHLSLDSATVMSSSTDDVTSSKRAPLHSTFNDGLSDDERPPVAKPETFSSSSNSPPSSDQLKLEIDEDSSYFDQSVTKPKADDVSIGDDNAPRYHGNLFARNEQLSRERDEEAVRSIMGGNTEIGVVAMDESMEDDVTETMAGNEVGLEGRSEEDEQELAAAVSSIFEDATCVGEDVYMLDVVKKAPPVQESQRIEGKLLDPFIFQTRRDEDVGQGRSLINHEKKFTNKFDISLQSANVTTEPEDSNLLHLPQSFICSSNDDAVCKENEKDSMLKSGSDLDGMESPMSEEQQLLIDEDSYAGHLIDFQSQAKQNKNSLGNICDKYSKDIQFPHYMAAEENSFAIQNRNEDLQKTIHEKQKKRKQQEELKRRQIEEQRREEQEEVERRKFEEQQRKEQEEFKRRMFEEQKRKEQEEKVRRQIEERKRKEQEELKKRQIEEQQRKEQEEFKRRQFEEQKRKEQEELNRRQFEEQKRKEQEELKRMMFEEQKRKEQEELERKMFEEQQKKEQEELKRRQFEEQQRKEQEELKRRQIEEHKRKEQEKIRRQFEEEKRKQEEYQRRMFEEQKRKQEEYQRRMFEEQQRKEQEELKRRQFEEQKRKQEEYQRRMFEEQKRKEQEELKRRQFEEQKRKEQEELKRRQIEEQQRKEQEEFKRRQFEEQKRKEQEESDRRKFEELKRKEQEEFKRRQIEEQKRKEQEELKKRQIEEQKRKEQEEFKRRQFEEQKRKEQEELERRQFEEQRRKQEEYQRRMFEEQQRKEQEELKRRQFEEQKRKQEEFQRHQEELQRRQVEDQKRKQQQQFEMLEKSSQLQHSHLHNQIKTDKDDVKMKRLSADNTGAPISEHIQRQQTKNVHDLIKYSPVVQQTVNKDNPTSYNIPSNAVFSYDFKDKNLPTNSTLIKSVYGSMQPASDVHDPSNLSILSRHSQKLTSQHPSSTYETFNFPSTKAFPAKTTSVAEQSCCATSTNVYKQTDKIPLQNINKIQLTNTCCEQPTSLPSTIGAKKNEKVYKKIEDSMEDRRMVSSPYHLQNNSRRCSPNTEIEKAGDERSNAGSRRPSKEFNSERKNCEKQEMKQSSKQLHHPETQSRCNSQLIQHLHMTTPHLIHSQPRCPQQQRVPLLHHTSQLPASTYLSDLRPFTSQAAMNKTSNSSSVKSSHNFYNQPPPVSSIDHVPPFSQGVLNLTGLIPYALRPEAMYARSAFHPGHQPPFPAHQPLTFAMSLNPQGLQQQSMMRSSPRSPQTTSIRHLPPSRPHPKPKGPSTPPKPPPTVDKSIDKKVEEHFVKSGQYARHASAISRFQHQFQSSGFPTVHPVQFNPRVTPAAPSGMTSRDGIQRFPSILRYHHPPAAPFIWGAAGPAPEYMPRLPWPVDGLPLQPPVPTSSVARNAVHQQPMTSQQASKPPKQEVQASTSAELPSAHGNDVLYSRYPIVWQGNIIVKSQEASVQIHYIAGNREIATSKLPKSKIVTDSGHLLANLRIKDRLRVTPQNLDLLNSKMMDELSYCMLLALPCGRDSTDLHKQTTLLKSKFIDYLRDKNVAGIINLESNEKQPHVLHFFPPGDFSNENIQLRAPDLYINVTDIHHLMLLIMPA